MSHNVAIIEHEFQKAKTDFKLYRLMEWAGFKLSDFARYEIKTGVPTNIRELVVIPLGPMATESLLGSPNFLAKRGYIEGREGKYYLPTVTPGFIQAGQSKWSAAFVNDVQKAVHLARNGMPPQVTDYVLDPSPMRAYQWALEYREALRRNLTLKCAFDIETPMKGDDEDDVDLDSDAPDKSWNIERISFAYGPLSGISFVWSPEYYAAVRTVLESDGPKVVWNCPAPDQKVLMADLSWIPAGNLKIGDKIVSFDEEPQPSRKTRRYSSGTVTNAERGFEELFEITFDDNSKVKVTGDHQWLARPGSNTLKPYCWIRTKNLKIGSKITKFFAPWKEDLSKDAGYLAGFFDGEGYCSVDQHGSVTVGASQNIGPTLDNVVEMLNKRNFSLSLNRTNRAKEIKIRQIDILGGISESVRFLGEIRPKRLLSKMNPDKLGAVQAPANFRRKVVSIVSLGRQEIVKLSVDKKTYILEGFTSHNCGYDVPRIRRQGFIINGLIHDGMVAWHILHSDLPKSLRFVATFTCPWQPAWKHLSGARPAFYSATDSDVEWRSMERIEEELKKTDLWNVYQKDVLDLEPILVHMQSHGMPVDGKIRLDRALKLDKKLKETQTIMEACVPLEARRIDRIYKTTPKDTTGLSHRPSTRQVSTCSVCGVERPGKNHWRRFKKKINPCSDGTANQTTKNVTEFYRLSDFKPSREQLVRYHNLIERPLPTVWDKKERKRKVSFGEEQLKDLQIKFPSDPLYSTILEYRSIDKLAGTYIGRVEE